MRIFHLISSTGFYGAEKMIASLASAQRESGHLACIEILTPDPDRIMNFVTECRRLDVPVHVTRTGGKLQASVIGALKKRRDSFKPDLVHSHNYKSDFYNVMMTKSSPARRVSTIHGFTKQNWKVSFYEIFDRWLLRHHFHGVVLVSEVLKERMSHQNSAVIPNGLNPDEWQAPSRDGRVSFRAKHHIPDGAFVIACVGRLSVEKNQRYLLDQARSWLTAGDPVRLVFIGDGELRRDLEEQCRQAGLSEKVIFTGRIDDMLTAYRAVDVCVLPSLTEGLPMNILECFAAGLPVIASRVGGIPFVIENGSNGLLFDHDDPETLRSAFEAVANDQDLRDSLIRQARATLAREFTLQKVQLSYESFYKRLLFQHNEQVRKNESE